MIHPRLPTRWSCFIGYPQDDHALIHSIHHLWDIWKKALVLTNNSSSIWLAPIHFHHGNYMNLCRILLDQEIIKSPKQRLETYCFCSVSSYYYYYYYSYSSSCSCYSPFFPCTMNLSMADLRNYRQNFMKLGGVIDICF